MLSMLAERNKAPRVIDKMALEWLAAYLVTTRQIGLRFLPGPEERGDLTKPAEQHAHADASWNSSDDGMSRLGRCIGLGTYTLWELGMAISAPFFAKSGKEKGVSSTSVSQAELKSAVLTVGDIQIYRGIAEEIAGVADRATISDVPAGAAGPTCMLTAHTKQALEDFIRPPPTVLAQDNKSIVVAAAQDTSKKGQKMRHLARTLQYLRTATVEGLVEVRSVPAAQQRANILTKNLVSPTAHWREVEFVQGTQEAVKYFQGEAAAYGRLKKSPRQLGHSVSTSINEEQGDVYSTWEAVQLVETTASNTLKNAAGRKEYKAHFIWPTDLQGRSSPPQFRFYKKPRGARYWTRHWEADLEIRDCAHCLLQQPAKRTPTAFGLCNHCAIKHHCLKVDWCSLISLDGTTRVRVLGLICCVDANLQEDYNDRHRNPQVWRAGEKVGTRKANLLRDGRPAQREPAQYGGEEINTEEKIRRYTGKCIGPYMIELDQRGTRMLDAATKRGLLSFANTARVGAGGGEQANMRFAPPAPRSIKITADTTEAVYHGDHIFGHYYNNVSLELIDDEGTEYRFETS